MFVGDKLVAALVGDIVASREYPDQSRLLTRVSGVLSHVNTMVVPGQPLEITVGDEFQGAYEDVGRVLLASLLVRVLLADVDRAVPGMPHSSSLDLAVDVRMGVGLGDVEQTDAARAPLGQSGSAWWHAREALNEVRGAASRNEWPRTWRTGFAANDRDLSGAVRAHLLCRDEMVARLDARDRRILLGLLQGERQAHVAEALGISQPAVASRQRDHGLNAIFRAQRALLEMPTS